VILVEESHTFSPIFQGLKLDWKPLSIICCIASLWQARASSRILVSEARRSSMAGTFVGENARGIPQGSYPIMRKNGEVLRALCLRELWTNSVRGRCWAHSVGAEWQ
jgi:hypothetical protein